MFSRIQNWGFKLSCRVVDSHGVVFLCPIFLNCVFIVARAGFELITPASGYHHITYSEHASCLCVGRVLALLTLSKSLAEGGFEPLAIRSMRKNLTTELS